MDDVNFIVIALKWYGKNVVRNTKGFGKEFLYRNKYAKCIYCNTKLTKNNVTADHIIPISEGGTNAKVNLVAVCYDCNQERQSIPFNEFMRYKNPKYLNRKYIFI